MRHRLTLFLLLGAVLVALGEWDAHSHRFRFADGLNDAWREFCVANAAGKIGDPAVTLVRINDEYEPAIGDSFTQADYATILRFVENFEPKTVAFEPNPVFDPAEPINQTFELLKEAALPLPSLTLGAVAENGQPPQSPEEEPKFPVLTSVEGDVSTLTPITRVVAAPNPQLLANGEPAFTGIELAGNPEDAGERRVNLIARHGDQVVPSFILHAVANHAEIPLDQVSVQLPPAVTEPVVRVGDAYEIPIDTRGRMKVYEHSGIDTAFYPSISAFHLALTGDEDETIKKLLANLETAFASLKTNLVVIGNDRSEARVEKVSTVPRSLARSELLTRAIATVQSGRYIEWWPFWARLLGFAVITALAAWAFRGSRKRAILWAILGAFFYFAASMVIFISSLAWAPAFAPLALFGLMLVIALVLPDPAKDLQAFQAVEPESSPSPARTPSPGAGTPASPPATT
ncbi:MAG: CHASE2 domain-containing protein [Verrucomicrobiae bacterium]|nr:CHASE2 domain-containing protein [Verrucomicrobiae bacterium]